jgi:predicted transcriptional regulator of viral defense system
MNNTIKHTNDFLHHIRSNGRYAFTLDELFNEIPKSVKNIRKDIDRLRDKGNIINIRRGFYTIVPDEYKNMGAIPVEFYIDELMKFLSKKYYVALLSAAMLHGAAHQQPQEFFIISQSPKPRKIKNDNFHINFSEKKNFSVYGIEDKKTDTGYLKISNRELTFMDLIYFEHAMGGYNRIMTILQELTEGINVYKMKDVLKNDFPIPTIQRAGYVAENIFFNNKLANILEKKLTKLKLKTVPLKSSGKNNGDRDDKWKVIINTQIESDI